MRVGVIGAGAIGGTIAAILDRAGHEVEVTARGGHLAAIRERGIRLTGAWGSHVARVGTGTELSYAKDLIVVSTKAQDAAAAIAANGPLLARTPIVVIQNGLSGIETATAAAPRSDVVGALALFAASFLAPGEVTVTAPGLTVLGSADPAHDLPVRYVAGVLGAVMPVSVISDFAGAQWTKLVVNQVNALPAITGLSAQAVIARRELRPIMTAGMRETVRIGLRTGVRFGTLQGLSHGRLALFARLPLGIGQLLPLEFARRMGPVPNPGSTLQSIRRGQASEIDFLNGAVVDAATRVGMPAPVNAALLDLVHEVERSGEFVTPDAVAARVAHGGAPAAGTRGAPAA